LLAVTLLFVQRREQVFLAVKTIQELFALLVPLFAILKIFVELLSLAMRLPKQRWRGKLLVRTVFVWRKNLLLRENVMVSSALELASEMELLASKTRKEQKKTFWLPLSLAKWTRWFIWANCLRKMMRNGFVGLGQLRWAGILCLS
jgi:hypothetical protein